MDAQVAIKVADDTQKTPKERQQRRRRKRASWKSDALRPRSAITSGKKLFVGENANPNTAWARRFQDLYIGHISDLGGFDNLSNSQLSLIKRCASIQCELERLDARLSNGDPINLSEYARVSGHLRRIFETLGLKRTQRDITPPTLDAYLAHKKANKPAAVAVTDQSDG